MIQNYIYTQQKIEILVHHPFISEGAPSVFWRWLSGVTDFEGRREEGHQAWGLRNREKGGKG